MNFETHSLCEDLQILNDPKGAIAIDSATLVLCQPWVVLDKLVNKLLVDEGEDIVELFKLFKMKSI